MQARAQLHMLRNIRHLSDQNALHWALKRIFRLQIEIPRILIQEVICTQVVYSGFDLDGNQSTNAAARWVLRLPEKSGNQTNRHFIEEVRR